MTVTIAIPYFNAADSIDRAVFSALHQTYSRIRVVVVGDGEEPPIRYRDRRLTIYTLPRNHGGAPFAQQVALLATPDEWYAPLGADDWLDPHHIRRLLDVGQSAVATGTVFWHRQDAIGQPHRNYGARRVFYETGIFTTERLRSIGGYDPREKSGQDNCVLWLLEIFGGLSVRRGTPTYHRVKRMDRSISVRVVGTAERRRSDARTAALVADARAGATLEQIRARRTPGSQLARELQRHVARLRARLEAARA